MKTTRVWAHEQFGAAILGDLRRNRRLVQMAEGAARRPSGRVSEVFTRAKDREGAYDFLENSNISVDAVAGSMFAATANRAKGESFAFVSIDLTSLSLPDRENEKFGPIGSPNAPVRGLMVANAYAVTAGGVPLGLVDQQYWLRDETEVLSKQARTERNQSRPFEDKQGARFATAAKNSISRLAKVGVYPWLVIDREGDNRDIIFTLAKMDCLFTVRATWDRRIGGGRAAPKLREQLEREPTLGTTDIEIVRNGSRAARTLTLEIRAMTSTVQFARANRSETLDIGVVLVREKGRRGPKRGAIDWMLYTNAPIATAQQAFDIVAAYRVRWRIEEFHKTWKSGACNVETAQLRSFEAVAKWATLLSAVATRIERLKYLARATPNAPISMELEAVEIEALIIERKSRVGRMKKLSQMPSVSEATRWIAEMGGWMGERTSGEPGSTTIARGLQVLAVYVQAINDVRAASNHFKPTPK